MILAYLQRLAIPIILSLAMFIAGYLYKGHRVSVDNAQQEGKQNAVTETTVAAVQAADSHMVNRLQSALSASKARADSLEKQLKDQANATPADPVCALPVGLRDQLNADLAADSR